MDDMIKFVLLIVIGAIGVFFAFSLIDPTILSVFGAGTNAPLSANIQAVVGGSFRPQENTDVETFVYISYDNLKHVHRVRFSDAYKARITAVYATDNIQTIYSATTQSLFKSIDGGLNFDQIKNQYITPTTTILTLATNEQKKTIYISTYANGRGAIYKTEDNFATLNAVVDFKKEAAYALVVSPHGLYLGMSNGQLVRYIEETKTLETIEEFSVQITHIITKNSDTYIVVKGGAVYKGVSLEGPFKKIRIPGGGFFSNTGVQKIYAGEDGSLYIQTKNGIYVSRNKGESFIKYERIPILMETIDTFGVSDEKLYIVSQGRVYVSSLEGIVWTVTEIPFTQAVWQSYFIGGGRVILSQ